MINLQELIEKHGVMEHGKFLHNIAKRMIRIKATKAPESSIPIGASRMGGDPDLPSNVEWPLYDNMPLAFLLQINLADLAAFPSSNFAAKEGMLYFFIDATELPENGRKRVIFSATTPNLLQRVRNPARKVGLDKRDGDYWKESSDSFLQPGDRFNSCRISFAEELSLPWPTSKTITGGIFGKDKTLMDRYNDIWMEWLKRGKMDGHYTALINESDSGRDYNDHHMFGYSSPIQNELDLGKNWELLLQLDSDNVPAWCWGDVGKIYFWIPKNSLAQNKFEDVFLDEQCG